MSTAGPRLVHGVLLVALGVRVWGIGFGLPSVIARPDETALAGPAVGFLSGDLRPPFLIWPTLMAYVVALLYLAYFAVTRAAGWYDTLAAFAESRRADISPFLYVSRGLSAVMGVMTVWGVYAIGRLVFDRTIALVSAGFLSLSFLHVRDSHFGVTDVPMTALVVLAVLAALRWRQSGGLLRAAGAGLATGLAASTKYNGLIACAPFAVAVVQRLAEERRAPADAIRRAAGAVAAFTAALALGLFGTSPYILVDWPRVVADLNATNSMLLHGHGIVVGRGWRYFAEVVLPAAVGWPILVAGVSGTFLLLATRFRQTAVLWAFPLAYYLIAGRGYAVFARYIIPVLPFLCLAAGWLTVETVRMLARGRSPAMQRGLVAAAAFAMVAPTAYNTILLDRLLSTTDNREIVARALAEAVPPGSLFYQSGEPQGHVPLGVAGHELSVRQVLFDADDGRFAPADPDWVLIQRSPLLVYSSVPPALERALKDRYVLARSFSTVADAGVDMTYDQQDAFFVPLSGLAGIARPGPSFELYRRRD
jgi:hypothetical protein